MADAYARMSGRSAALTVHQGCGLTNAMTGITEAAKSRTPLVVLAAEATARRGRTSTSTRRRWPPRSARCRCASRLGRRRGGAAAAGAYRRWASAGRVLLNLPLDVQAPARRTAPTGAPAAAGLRADPATASPRWPTPGRRPRPVFIAGRGARGAGARALEALADACGALLATSAVAKGLFDGNPWSLGTCPAGSPRRWPPS